MSEPWGLSGPEFLAAYGAAYVLLLAVSLVRGRLPGRGAGSAGGAGAGRPLDVHDVAYLSGGPDRVVDSAVVALVDAERVRATRNGRVRRLGDSDADDPVQRAVLRALSKSRTTPMSRVRAKVRREPEVAAVVTRLRKNGLGYTPGQRLGLRWLGALPLAVLTGVGVARLVNGVRLDRPVGFLVAFLVISMITVVALGLWGPAPFATASGRAAIRRLRGEARGIGRSVPESFAQASPYPLSAGAFGVALIGASGLEDTALRDAMYSSEGAARSFGGGGGSGSGAGGCGGGGGGGGCGGGCGG